MPLDDTRMLNDDATILRRMADHLERNVEDHEYHQASPHRCAMGHAIAGGVVAGWHAFKTEAKWARESAELFGSTPMSRSRTEAIELLRAQADRLVSIATERV